MFNATMIDESTLKAEMMSLPQKIRFRLLAKRVGWNIPRFLVIEFKIAKIGIHSSVVKNGPLPSDIIVKINHFVATIESNTVHCLLMEPELLNGEIQRKFIYTKEITADIVDFIEKLCDVGLLSKTQQFRLLLTEVITPECSGICYIQDNSSLIEVGFGQMIAKGIVETSQFRIADEKIQGRHIVIQKKMICIKDGEKFEVPISRAPLLEDAVIYSIYRKAIEFHEELQEYHSIEWFLDNHGRLFFSDAMPETNDVIHQDENSCVVKIEKDGAIIESKAGLHICRGKTAGYLKYICENQEFGQIVDTHHLSSMSKEKVGENESNSFIYLAEAPIISLERFIPTAKGFVFKRGSLLSHLSNLLRHNRIPSCIDADLFDKLKSIYQDHYCSISFSCGGEFPRSSSSDKEIEASLRRYQELLLKPPFLLEIVSPGALTINSYSVGWKSLNLNLLKKWGYLIPHTVIIPSDRCNSNDFMDYLESDAFRQVISLRFPNFSTSGKKLICRSSADIEDGVECCTAGLFESIPRIQSMHQLRESILRIRESSHSRRVQNQCDRDGISCMNVSMAIIIQEWIEPKFGGVVFTRQPGGVRNDNLLIELGLNSSDSVTSSSGEVFRIVLGKDLVEKDIGDQIDAFIKSQDLRNIVEQKQIFLLYKDCIELERRTGIPLDVEFVVGKGNHLYYVQSRYSGAK